MHFGRNKASRNTRWCGVLKGKVCMGGSGFSELDLVGSGSMIEITFHQANEKAAELHF